MFVACFLDGPVKWAIKPDAPTTLAITGLGHVVVTPLLNGFISRVNGRYRSYPLGPTSLVIESDLLVLNMDLPKGDVAAGALLTRVTQLMSVLRHLSRQASMGTRAIGFESIPSEIVLPERVFPQVGKSKVGVMRTSVVAAPVEWVEHLRGADAHGLETSFPIARTLMLDAVRAHEQGDHRTAIVYAAVAMEACASVALDNAMASALTKSPPDPRLRVVAMPQAEGRTVVKDHVYDYLSSTRGTPDFSQLLHVRPLYVMQKSLMLEDEPLFQTATRVYRTRNKLVHFGAVPVGREDLFDIDEEGALASIRCAARVLAWFGETDTCVLDDGGFVDILECTPRLPTR